MGPQVGDGRAVAVSVGDARQAVDIESRNTKVGPGVDRGRGFRQTEILGQIGRQVPVVEHLESHGARGQCRREGQTVLAAADPGDRAGDPVVVVLDDLVDHVACGVEDIGRRGALVGHGHVGEQGCVGEQRVLGGIPGQRHHLGLGEVSRHVVGEVGQLQVAPEVRVGDDRARPVAVQARAGSVRRQGVAHD